MSFGPNAKIKFKQSVAADVVANRIRIRPANTAAVKDDPFEDVPKPTPDADGFSRIVVGGLSQAQGLDGHYDVHVTALDDATPPGESGFLEIDDVDFDFAPPDAPTEGSIEE